MRSISMQRTPKTSGFLYLLTAALRGCAIGLIGAGLVGASPLLAQDNAPTRVRSLYEGHEFLYRVVKLYAGGK